MPEACQSCGQEIAYGVPCIRVTYGKASFSAHRTKNGYRPTVKANKGSDWFHQACAQNLAVRQ